MKTCHPKCSFRVAGLQQRFMEYEAFKKQHQVRYLKVPIVDKGVWANYGPTLPRR